LGLDAAGFSSASMRPGSDNQFMFWLSNQLRRNGSSTHAVEARRWTPAEAGPDPVTYMSRDHRPCEANTVVRPALSNASTS
jgi:hypothetical protein